ncbi:hypothetical protein FZI91_21065 [Mycobacterium sp. CBMA271]|nr:hypothetical protein [Mycobacteroides sp. CBMA 326]MUM24181.1 hypothetical protein [Mycobacteroides sp. CBMA 271]
MIAGSVWELLQVARVAILLCFLPVVLYRVWRVLRYPTSVPAVAVTSFGVLVWFWLLAFTDWVWAALPPVVHALCFGGLPTVTMAACLQVFVVGISGDASPERIRRGLRTTFAVTAIVLVVVTICVSQSNVLFATNDIYELIDALLHGGDRGSITAEVVSSGFMCAVLVQLAWAGMRHADRTPVGTGLGLLAAAAVFELVAISYGGLWRPLNQGHGNTLGTFGLWLESLPGCAGAVLIILGFLWPPVATHVQARRKRRMLQPLHDALEKLFPGVIPPMDQRIRLSDLIFEWTTHIQDGLTLLGQGRQVSPQTRDSIPGGCDERAVAVTNWLTGQDVPGFSSEWLRPPSGVSDEAWVLAIAEAYADFGESQIRRETTVCVLR